ncbi:MAG: sulfotransferase [Crocosphaera sp.]|nr:sulfotransferase [Crocosphaera sp.]
MEVGFQKRFDYVLIFGQGRSGTNWLLDTLDFSPLTHCRNEPDKLLNSPLLQLPSGVVDQSFEKSFGDQWDQAIALTSSRMGVRDRIAANPKIYLPEPMRLSIGRMVFAKSRVRKQLANLIPSCTSWSQEEWLIPSWYSSSLEISLPILKLNQTPAWGKWVLENRPQALIIHIVRHPGGFLNSWKQRYVKSKSLEQIRQANNKRLQSIVQVDSQWAKRIGNIEGMNVEESELWYWCYANEVINSAGKGKDNYLHIVYEDLVADPIKISQLLYKTAGLPWSQEIEQQVLKNSSQSNQIAKSWYQNLSTKEIELVKQCLKDSFMGQWWSEEQDS